MTKQNETSEVWTEQCSSYLDGRREEMIRELADIVKIPSVSSDLPMVKSCLTSVLNLASRLGLASRNLLDGTVGVVEMGEGNETLGILSHVDVVPPGDIVLWKSDPFQMDARNGRLYGRGTLDDKGAIIASLYAMKAVSQIGIPLKKKVQLILGTQEEVEWTDMDAYVKQFPLPDYGFTPDGEFPVCNIEKGFAEIIITVPVKQERASSEDDFCIVSMSGGSSPNTIPGSASAKLAKGTYERTITASGVSAHSCLPSNGDNAILNLCKQIKDLPSNIFTETATWLLESFSDTEGRGIGLYRENDMLNGEFIHRNTVAPTMLATQSEQIVITFNARFTCGTTEDQVKDAFAQAADKIGGKAVIINIQPVVYISRQKPFLQLLAESYERVSGLKNEFTIAYGGSYAKAMPGIVSWGPIFPGEEDTCHEENEYITADSLMRNAKIFADTIASVALTEQSFR